MCQLSNAENLFISCTLTSRLRSIRADAKFPMVLIFLGREGEEWGASGSTSGELCDLASAQALLPTCTHVPHSGTKPHAYPPHLSYLLRVLLLGTLLSNLFRCLFHILPAGSLSKNPASVKPLLPFPFSPPPASHPQ